MGVCSIVVTGGASQAFGRRAGFALLAAAVVPRAAGGQEPQPTPQPPGAPISPQVGSPAPPVAPARPANLPGPAIDRSKLYFLFFERGIDVASMRGMRRQLAMLVEAGVPEITLVIDSSGGLLEPMLITYSFIRALPVKINTHAQGFVQSAATGLFLAGQDRSADRNVRFLFHPSTLPVTGNLTEPQIRDRLNQAATVQDAVSQIYRDRTNLTDLDIERFGRGEVYVTAEQAKTYGIVQTVADLRLPGEQRSRILFLD